MKTEPRDYIDWDEAREFLKPFYAEAEPCESCGRPTYKDREWDEESGLWVAVDCACNAPDVPTCPALIPLIEEAMTVDGLCRVVREHRLSCPTCGPIQLKKTADRERKAREAA
jgi:hypothetical protein